MATTRKTPDLVAYMNAYAVLEVEYSATAADIRRAYRQLAQHAHPDRQPHGSVEQQRATARMASINAAFELIRDAPLRHHRVSRYSDAHVHWSDQELQHAVRRARHERIAWEWVHVALCGIAGVVLSLGTVTQLGDRQVPGFSVYVIGVPLSFGLMAAYLGRRFFDAYYLSDMLLVMSRLGFRR